MISPRLLLILVTMAILLPIGVVVLLGAGTLLSALGDRTCGEFTRAGGLIVGLVWVLDLVFLLIALGVKAVTEDEES